MRIRLRAMLRVLLDATVLGGSVAMLVLALRTDLIPVVAAWATGYGASGPGRLLLAGIGCLGVVVLGGLLADWVRERLASREVSSSTEYGRVSVSVMALEEALGRALASVDRVRRAAVEVRDEPAKRSIVITARLALLDDGDVTSVTRRCQELLRRRFAELMPERTAVLVNIVVARLARPEPAAEPALPWVPSDPEPEQPQPTTLFLADASSTDASSTDDDDTLYHGPRWPVEDDSLDDNPRGEALPPDPQARR